MKYLQKTHIVFALLLLFWDIALSVAQPITESEGTPSASVLQKTKILLTELSFKNSEADYLKFTVISAPQSPLNLKGLTFQDDNDFKTLNTDFNVYPGQVITLLFKQSTADVVPTINTTKTGLTATTEQMIIKDEKGKILDAVCWANSKPTTIELTDLSDLYDQEAWISNTAGSCLPSDEVETNGSVKRKNITDTNSLSDWEIINPPTEKEPLETPLDPSGSTTVSPTSIEDTILNDTESASAENISLLEDEENSDETQTDSNPITISSLPVSASAKSTTKTNSTKSTKKPATKKTKKNTSKKIYQNGDESTDIHINEIMANPSEPDQQNEWIEIINTSDITVNLGNWQLDDDEGGSKPYVLPDTINIEPNVPLLIPITESKISLANKQDKVRILNFKDEIINEVTYQDGGEDMAYARILVSEENYNLVDTQEILIPITSAQATNISEATTWMWVKEGTPGEQNPSMQKVHGIIIEEPQFTTPYSFKIQISDQQLNIFFDESIIKAPLADSLFTQNSPIDLLLKPDEDGNLWMQKYEILETTQASNDFSLIPWLAAGLILSASGAFLYLQKKLPWQKKNAVSIKKSQTMS